MDGQSVAGVGSALTVHTQQLRREYVAITEADKELRFLHSGPEVKAYQALLNGALGHLGIHLEEDGLFGPATRDAVVRYQEFVNASAAARFGEPVQHLAVTGRIDAATREKLENAICATETLPPAKLPTQARENPKLALQAPPTKARIQAPSRPQAKEPAPEETPKSAADVTVTPNAISPRPVRKARAPIVNEAKESAAQAPVEVTTGDAVTALPTRPRHRRESSEAAEAAANSRPPARPRVRAEPGAAAGASDLAE